MNKEETVQNVTYFSTRETEGRIHETAQTLMIVLSLIFNFSPKRMQMFP